MDRELVVYVLRFSAPAPLTHAFDRIAACPDVASCSLELPERQLRMVAPRSIADRMVERLYLDGGLA